MLDGVRYFAEFPDESTAPTPRAPSSPVLRATLALIEKELRDCLRAERQARNGTGSAGAREDDGSRRSPG